MTNDARPLDRLLPEATIDPMMLAARRHCTPQCPGPSPAELAGLARPHSCARTAAAADAGQRATAEAFVAEALAGTAALAQSREAARNTAALLEGELAAVRETLGTVLAGCPDHAPGQEQPTCGVCTLDAWAKGDDDALELYMAGRADE